MELPMPAISVRFPIKVWEELDSKIGKHKQFKDRTDCIRFYFERGRQFESLLQIYNNPEKRKEFDKKLKSLAKEKHVEKILETMDIQQIEAIVFVANNMKDKKVQQLLLDVKRS